MLPSPGWRLHGELCHGRGLGDRTGYVWECPLLCDLAALPQPLAREPLLPGMAQLHHTALAAAAAAAEDGSGSQVGLRLVGHTSYCLDYCKHASNQRCRKGTPAVVLLRPLSKSCLASAGGSTSARAAHRLVFCSG